MEHCEVTLSDCHDGGCPLFVAKEGQVAKEVTCFVRVHFRHYVLRQLGPLQSVRAAIYLGDVKLRKGFVLPVHFFVDKGTF